MRDLLRRVAALERQQVRLRVGEVTGTAPLDVALGGSDTSYEDVASVGAVASGDGVATIVSGHDLLVLGAIGDGGRRKVAFPFAAGWGNYSGAYEDASYSKVGNLVILQGLVTKSGGTPAADDLIGTLPAGFRPTETLLFMQASGATSSAGRVDVWSDGSVRWITGSTTETDHMSLSGIVFMVD